MVRLSCAFQCILTAADGTSAAPELAVYLEHEAPTTAALWKHVQNRVMNFAYNDPSPNSITGMTVATTTRRATVLHEASQTFRVALRSMKEELEESHRALQLLRPEYDGKRLSVRWTEKAPVPGLNPLVDERFTRKHLQHRPIVSV